MISTTTTTFTWREAHIGLAMTATLPDFACYNLNKNKGRMISTTITTFTWREAHIGLAMTATLPDFARYNSEQKQSGE
jgi:hypothetical protein